MQSTMRQISDAKKNDQAGGQPGADNKMGQQGQGTPQQQQQTLNEANLQQHQQNLRQQQQAAMARKNESKPPAAPTSAHPPQAFPPVTSHSSPQGVPKYAAPSNAIELKMPDMPPKKKLKPNGQGRSGSVSSSPATQNAQNPIASPQPGRPAGDVKRAPAPPPAVQEPPKPSFKCNVQECEFHHTGFATKEELDRHSEVHVDVSDPLAFSLAELASNLGLELDGEGNVKYLPPDTNILRLDGAKGTRPGIKQEGGTPASVATPGRPGTQQGINPSPSKNGLLKTPQAGAKALPGKAGDKAGDKSKDVMEIDIDVASWAKSSIGQTELPSIFSELDDSIEPVWLLRAPSQSSTSTSTTPSSVLSKESEQTEPSNISENDHLQIQLGFTDLLKLDEDMAAMNPAFALDFDLDNYGTEFKDITTTDLGADDIFGEIMSNMPPPIKVDDKTDLKLDDDMFAGLVDLDDWNGSFGPATGLEDGDGIPGWGKKA